MKLRSWILFIPTFLLTILVVNQYLFCPQYDFPEPHPFSGSLIYNPYEGQDSFRWKKCNFHTHTTSWFGLTNGKASAADAWRIYDSLGYAIHCISNYHNIDHYNNAQPNYIEAYEHGYGILKNHQNVLGTTNVVWGDYLLPQTLANKQHIISLLHTSDSMVIVINHPENRYAYNADDMKFLSGYNCMELFPSCSMAEWDAALSAGNPVFTISDDDAHDVTDAKQVGRNCTFVEVAEVTKKNILHSLVTGRCYSMVINYEPGESFEKKMAKVKSGWPMVEHVNVKNNTLHVSFNQVAAAIKFTGQDGITLSVQRDCSSASWKIRPTDTYVRTRIFFKDGYEINLNPVFRYDGHLPISEIPPVNKTKTILFRIAGGMIIALAGLTPFVRRRKIQK